MAREMVEIDGEVGLSIEADGTARWQGPNQPWLTRAKMMKEIARQIRRTEERREQLERALRAVARSEES